MKVIEPLLVTIPHCAPRVASREAIIRVISDDGRWTDYPTTEATVEDMKVHVSLEQGTLYENNTAFLDYYIGLLNKLSLCLCAHVDKIFVGG